MYFDTFEKIIAGYVDNMLRESEELFLVEMKISPGNNIKIYLDADNGITIDRCIKINRALYKQIEESLFPDGNFSLEVSSPGLDEPLKLHRQYKKNINRSVEVVLNDETKKQGKLISVTDDNITIEETEGKTKRPITKQAVILFNQIKHTKVLVTF